MPNSFPVLPAYDRRPNRTPVVRTPQQEVPDVSVTPSTGNILQRRPGAVGSADSHLSADAADEQFEPHEHTVDQVKEYVEANPAEAEAVFGAEVDGKNRSTLTAWITDFVIERDASADDED